MSDTKVAPHGPFVIEVAFHVTNGDLDAQLTFDVPIGNLPREEDIAILAESAMKAIKEAQGDGWRFKTREEFVQDQLSSRAGLPSSMKFAVPSGEFSHAWVNGVGE